MARTVSWAASEGARDPLGDEKEVMRTFHKHVKHCDTCYRNLTSWHSGNGLCSRGHNYVIDMLPYFFCKSGKPYSLIDRTRKNEQTRVLVPVEYRHVSTLFEALEGGYNTNASRQSRPKPIVHHTQPDVSHYESRRPERPNLQIPYERYTSSRHTPRSAERYHEDRRYYEPRSRGSLYHEDERRRHRYSGEGIYASVPRSPRHHL
ncbi:hypothetical protein LTR64_002764 [Lithohypha guttulata]|nr:hypothetical protein LTR51_001011 [Lithohypha guttulata]